MSLGAIVEKEVADLIREKRYGAWALAFLAFWTFVLVTYLVDVRQSALQNREYPMGVLTLAEPAFFVFSLAFLVLALLVLSDGVTKERESGMLPLVGAAPIVRWHVVLAKLIAGLVAYVLTFLVSLLPVGVFAATAGTPIIELLLRLFLGPFFALYAFFLGVGLLLGVAFHTSKAAIGTGAALYLPLFLMMREGPFQMLYASYPLLGRIASYTPFDAVFRGTRAIAHGGIMPWGGLAAALIMGAAAAAAAFWLFQRQEVAA